MTSHNRRSMRILASSWRLKSLLRPIVSDVIAESKIKSLQSHTEVEIKYSHILKILSYSVIVLCFFGCCFQIYDLTRRLLSFPIAVNIYFSDVTSFFIPPLVFFSAENDYVTSQIGYSENPVECALPIQSLLRKEGTNYTKIWTYDNHSISLSSYEFNNNEKNITVTTEVSPLGQATKFGTGMVLTGKQLTSENLIKLIIRKRKMCSPTITLFTLEDKIEFRMFFFVVSGFLYNIEATKRRYKFLNTPRQKCCESDEFTKCYKNCITKDIRSKSECRLPFFSPTINLPPCNNATMAYKSFVEIFKIYTTFKVFTECGCIRTCKSELYTFLPNVQRWFLNESVINIKISPFDMQIVERLAYNLSNLLADVGGNLGLFLGLSILSILDIFYTTTKRVKKKYSKNRPPQIVLKIRRSVITVYERFEPMKSKKDQQSKTLSLQFLNVIVTVTCIFLAMFMIQDRIQYYFTYSVRHVVSVEERDTVAFPSLTICGTSEKLILLKRRYAKANNISNWCDIDMLDMLRGKKSSVVDTIWSKSEPKFINNMPNLIKSATNLPTVSPNYTSISTGLGLCSHFKFKNESYVGYFTLYVIAYWRSSLVNCKENYYSIFYDDTFSDTFNILTRMEAPVTAFSLIDYRLIEIQRLKSSNRPCVSKEDSRNCFNQCLEKNLRKEKNLCKLPMLSMLPNLTQCSTPERAKESREKYEIILTRVTLGVVCSCTKPCKEQVILLSHFSIVRREDSFVLTFTMNSNIVETIVQVENYSLIALFTDFGNSLGLAIGLSILTATKYFRNLVFTFLDVMKKIVR